MSVVTRPPVPTLRQRLRPLWASPGVALANLAALALLAVAIPPILDWAVFSATWTADDMNGCPPQGGACWAFVAAKARLILFGRYTFDEQWRPALATALLVLLTALSLNPRRWGRGLAAGWVLGLGGYGLLMWGGVPGLPPVPSNQWGGLPLTILLTIFGVFFGILVAVPLALARQSEMPVFRLVATAYIEAMRGVPLIAVLFMASIMIPMALPEGLTPSGLGRVLVGLVAFIAAYMAEILRGGLQAIPRGQVEAARALGLSWTAMQLRVVLPQVFEMTLPSTVNLIISALKGTSLVVIVAMMDLLGAAQASLADPKWIGFFVEAYAFAAAIYAVLCGAISWHGRRVETNLRRARGR